MVLEMAQFVDLEAEASDLTDSPDEKEVEKECDGYDTSDSFIATDVDDEFDDPPCVRRLPFTLNRHNARVFRSDDENDSALDMIDLTQDEKKTIAKTVKPYRVRKKGVMLTLQHCKLVSSADVLHSLLRWEHMNPMPDKAVVCQEDHEDGSVHYHCALWFENRSDFRVYQDKAREFFKCTNMNVGKQKRRPGDPPVEELRSWSKILEYATKNATLDKIATHPSDYQYQEETVQEKVSVAVYKMFQSGENMERVLERHPSYAMANFKHLEYIRSKVQFYKAQPELKDWKTVTSDSRWNPKYTDKLDITYPVQWSKYLPDKSLALMIWMLINVRNPDRRVNQRHLWITGDTGIGKSFTFKCFGDYLRIYPCRNWNNWADYDSKQFDLIVLDEFNGGQTELTERKNPQFLNSLCDCADIYLNVKHGHYYKRDRMPIVVLSNSSITECFPREEGFTEIIQRTVKRRFIELNFMAKTVDLFIPPSVDDVEVFPEVLDIPSPVQQIDDDTRSFLAQRDSHNRRIARNGRSKVPMSALRRLVD